MTVDEILDDIIRKEGGYVNNPADGGGPTNMGITIGTLSEYYGRKVSIQEVKALTVDQAKEIYTRRYFFGPRFDSLPADVQPIATDTGVLFGPRAAVQFMQKIVNEAGFGPIDQDGILGPNTRNAIERAYNAMGPFFINAIVEERITFHQMRVQERPDQGIFLQGWINRAETFRIPV